MPLGKGIVLDPFMGGGSTIAAAVSVGYESIGPEHDPAFFERASSEFRSSLLMATGRAMRTPVILPLSATNKGLRCSMNRENVFAQWLSIQRDSTARSHCRPN